MMKCQYHYLCQGVWGFITGGLVWFSIPFTLATTMGLAYLGLSSAQGAPLLSDDDVMKVRLENKTVYFFLVLTTVKLRLNRNLKFWLNESEQESKFIFQNPPNTHQSSFDWTRAIT